MKPKIISIALGAMAVVLGYSLFKYSLYLAAMRIYQVDECQNVFTARILATGQADNYFTSITLFLAPLAWLARTVTQSVDLFASARLVSLLIFWVNLLLLTLATGQKLLSRRGLIAFVGAATLVPLWDYGFEVRHDNLLLTGLLLTWCVVRVGRAGLHSYVIVGALAVAMQFIAFKAFVYTLPLAVMVVLFPPFEGRIPWWKLLLAWVVGGLGMFVVIRLAYGAAGIWEAYIAGFRWVSEVSTGGDRFAPWNTLRRLLIQTPLLLAVGLAGLLAVFLDWRRRGRAALNWEGLIPEALFLLVTFAALVANPAPHPYNLVNLVPFAYLFAFRYAASVSKEVWTHPAFRPVVITVLFFAHLVPFIIATGRHVDWPNYRQERLMQTAESLTDPVKDPVYDGIGMVPTRRSIHFRWFLHSLNIRSFKAGPGPRVREMLAAQPSAVIITSYRTDWLAEEDHIFIREHYVPLADDFWVLGRLLPAGGGSFEIIHPGRYQITPKEASCIQETIERDGYGLVIPTTKTNCIGTLDGIPLTGKPVELTVGKHRIETTTDCEPAVVWLGPKQERLKPIGDSHHLRLFVNWY